MMPFLDAFVSSLLMIIMTEIGDKTFFIAAILCMKHNKVLIFSAAIAALGIMTVISAYIGHIVMYIISPIVTTWISAALFIFFGLKMIKEGYDHEETEGDPEEMAEAAADVLKATGGAPDGCVPLAADAGDSPLAGEDGGLDGADGGDGATLACGAVASASGARVGAVAVADGGLAAEEAEARDAGEGVVVADRAPAKGALSPRSLWWITFVMTFTAEWGDRSQIATIALGADKSPLIVSLGAVLGHALCTGVACIGGALLKDRISMRLVRASMGDAVV